MLSVCTHAPSTQGPPVLFNRANPKLANPLAEGALRLHKQGFELAHDVHKRGGGVVIEHPVLTRCGR